MYVEIIRIVILAIATCILVGLFESSKDSDNNVLCFVFGIGALILFVVTAVYAIMFVIHLLQALNRIWWGYDKNGSFMYSDYKYSYSNIRLNRFV